MYERKICYTVADQAGSVYEVMCRVGVKLDETTETASVWLCPRQGQFRVSAISVLLADVRTIYLEARLQQELLPRLSNRVLLELADPVSVADVAWMQRQAWLLGVELAIHELSGP